MLGRKFFIDGIPYPFTIKEFNKQWTINPEVYGMATCNINNLVSLQNLQKSYYKKNGYIKPSSFYKINVYLEPKGLLCGFFIRNIPTTLTNFSNEIEIEFVVDYIDIEYENIIQKRKRKLKSLKI